MLRRIIADMPGKHKIDPRMLSNIIIDSSVY